MTQIEPEIPSRTLCYLRPSIDKKFPAEICVMGDDNHYRVFAVSEQALLNLLRTGTDLLSEFRGNYDNAKRNG